MFFKFPAELTYGTGNYMATLEIRGVSDRGTKTLPEMITLVGPFAEVE